MLDYFEMLISKLSLLYPLLGFLVIDSSDASLPIEQSNSNLTSIQPFKVSRFNMPIEHPCTISKFLNDKPNPSLDKNSFINSNLFQNAYDKVMNKLGISQKERKELNPQNENFLKKFASIIEK